MTLHPLPPLPSGYDGALRFGAIDRFADIADVTSDGSYIAGITGSGVVEWFDEPVPDADRPAVEAWLCAAHAAWLALTAQPAAEMEWRSVADDPPPVGAIIVVRDPTGDTTYQPHARRVMSKQYQPYGGVDVESVAHGTRDYACGFCEWRPAHDGSTDRAVVPR